MPFRFTIPCGILHKAHVGACGKLCHDLN